MQRYKSVRVPRNSIKSKMKNAFVVKAKNHRRCKDEELNKRAQMSYINLNKMA